MIDEYTVQKIAAVCHEANAAWCRAHGDHSQPSWGVAPDWQQRSAIEGVLFHLANPEASPAHSHNNWLKHKQLTDWKYGPVKDELAKTHPCFVSFEDLPPMQQAKDKLFQAVVHALAPQRVTEEHAQTAAATEEAHG